MRFRVNRSIHVTIFLTNPFWSECGGAGAGDWKWGNGGVDVGESCTSDENRGYYGWKKGEDDEYHHWYKNIGTDIQRCNKCCSAITIDEEGNKSAQPSI